MTGHKTGTHEQWLAARLELLEAEKELTRRSDELAHRRRQLPWVAVDQQYVFDTDQGEKTLRDLFAGRSQLLVYHFMFGPEWTEGCPVCSFWADNFDRTVVHLNHRDVAEVNFKARERVGEEHAGLSAFALQDGVVHHTYSCYARGLEAFNGAYQLLDRAPHGCDEDQLPATVAWLRRHDNYDDAAAPA
jgi:predicted dithiol-disulfide oxidoreductase (DUF899 family)